MVIYEIRCTGCNEKLIVKIEGTKIIMNDRVVTEVKCPNCKSDYYLDIIKKVNGDLQQ